MARMITQKEETIQNEPISKQSRTGETSTEGRKFFKFLRQGVVVPHTQLLVSTLQEFLDPFLHQVWIWTVDGTVRE